jgi:hypothetical protein
MERAAARARNVRGLTREVVRPQRRLVLLAGVLLAAVVSFLIGMRAVIAVELGVGKSLSCWVWNQCPTRDAGAGGGAASGATMGTRPSILGGTQKKKSSVGPTSQLPVVPQGRLGGSSLCAPDCLEEILGSPFTGSCITPTPRTGALCALFTLQNHLFG